MPASERVRAGRPGNLDRNRGKQIEASAGGLGVDRALRHVAESVCSVVRESDFVGRIGGDRFAVILPEADGSGAAAVAKRAGESVAHRPVLLDGETGLHVRVRAGFAVYPEGGSTREELLGSATTALRQP